MDFITHDALQGEERERSFSFSCLLQTPVASLDCSPIYVYNHVHFIKAALFFWVCYSISGRWELFELWMQTEWRLTDVWKTKIQSEFIKKEADNEARRDLLPSWLKLDFWNFSSQQLETLHSTFHPGKRSGKLFQVCIKPFFYFNSQLILDLSNIFWLFSPHSLKFMLNNKFRKWIWCFF